MEWPEKWAHKEFIDSLGVPYEVVSPSDPRLNNNDNPAGDSMWCPKEKKLLLATNDTVDSMVHEFCHYLVAPRTRRAKMNYGLKYNGDSKSDTLEINCCYLQFFFLSEKFHWSKRQLEGLRTYYAFDADTVQDLVSWGKEIWEKKKSKEPVKLGRFLFL